MQFKKIVKNSLVFVVLLISTGSYAETIIEVKAQPQKGFNFPFILKIPTNVDTHYLVVETNNTGRVSDDLKVHYESAKKAISGNAVGPWVAKKINAPIMIPVFPRPKTDWEIYTHSLDRDTLLVKDGVLKRLDLQLLAMISEAQKELAKLSIKVQSKVILTGFSASGSFANRFSLLHPDSLQLIVAGGLNGILMLPVAAVSDEKLNFPLGVTDFESIIGTHFNKAKWASLPQFLFMGENDTNDAVKFDDAYSDAERKTIYTALSENMQPERWAKCQEIYKANNANVVFRTYKNIGHGTNLKIHNDILSFIQQNLK